MKKLLNKFKYRLLCWLLRDICGDRPCEECACCRENAECGMAVIYDQAHKAWGLEW